MRGPETCPKCGYDPTGPDLEDDSESVRSGGGWKFSNSVSDGVFTEELYCPMCDAIVARDRSEMGDPRAGHEDYR